MPFTGARVRYFVALLFVVAALSYAPPAKAIYLEIRTYYYDCCVYQIGHHFKWCNGTVSSGGTQSGQWKVVVSRDCSTGEELVEWYAWQWQTSSWSYVGDIGPDPEYCYC
ncbi:MAG TPA: hypothetical protein VFP80_17580 [Thermoanaerobaculia bacterium]|nr:hypothetical protein [Thermoanaerobaculia bacterium]